MFLVTCFGRRQLGQPSFSTFIKARCLKGKAYLGGSDVVRRRTYVRRQKKGPEATVEVLVGDPHGERLPTNANNLGCVTRGKSRKEAVLRTMGDEGALVRKRLRTSGPKGYSVRKQTQRQDTTAGQ